MSTSTRFAEEGVSSSGTKDEDDTTQPSPQLVEPIRETTLAQFHADMRRVLESRQDALAPFLETSRERRNRPVVLESDIDGAERVLRMLEHLIDRKMATEESFQLVMQAFVRRDRMRWYNGKHIICAADQVEELLKTLTRVKGATKEKVDGADETEELLSMDTYNLALQAYGACATPRGGRNYAQRAEELLKKMDASYGRENISVHSLSHVVHAFAWEQANLQPGSSASKAQSLLDRIEEDIEITKSLNNGDDASLDDTRYEVLMNCYSWVLEAWSKSGSEGSAGKAQTIFDKMIKLSESNREECSGEACVVDAEIYSNIILAWAKTSGVDATTRCDALLHDMLKKYKQGAFPEGSEPTLIAFNGVITAWGRIGKPEKADEILKLAEEIRPSCKNLNPDAVSYNTVLHAYLRHITGNKDKNLRTSDLENVRSLVDFMELNKSERPEMSPNSFTYTTLLKCLINCRDPDLAEEAEQILIKTEKLWSQGDKSVEPNNRIFNMALNAYAKSDDRGAAQRAVKLLRRMKSSKMCPPDNISYTSTLECLSKSADPNAPLLAIELLDELFELYRESLDPSHLPNLRTFTMAILTLSKNNGSVSKARALLKQLLEMYERTQDPQLRPNEFPYNYVLNCAANTLEDQSMAFKIATETYQEMRKSELVRPDCFTYAFWLKCCNNLLPRGELRNKCVKYAFEECKSDGLVTNELLTRLFQGSPPEVVDSLLDLKEKTNYRLLRIDDLPPAWSRNARPRR